MGIIVLSSASGGVVMLLLPVTIARPFRLRHGRRAGDP
jgi:hypothetical protein